MKYDLSRRTTVRKVTSKILLTIYFIAFFYFYICVTAHHLFTWDELRTPGPGLWAFLRCLLILALFPATILPVIFFFKRKRPYEPEHKFYSEWARVFTGYGKGQHDQFFVEDIKCVQVQRTSFEDRPLFFVRVWFKPWDFPFIGKRGDVRFAIRADSQVDLEPLCDWLRTNRIEVIWEQAEVIHRRS